MSTIVSLAQDSEELARHYESASIDRQFKAGLALIEELRPLPGESVLDVGTGTGLLAEHVAGLVAPGGSVTGIDPLPLRIELAQRRAGPDLHFAVGDARDLSAFATGGFDLAYLNAVFHWIDDKARALNEIARVLRRGGRIGISTGAKDQPNPLQAIATEILSRPPYRDYPMASSGAVLHVTGEELEALLAEAGFVERRVELRANTQLHASPQALTLFSQASSFGNFLGHLPPALRQAAQDEIERGMEALRTPDGIRLDSVRLLAIAVKG